MIKISELPIPTDNLYKFIAISGLIILLLSIVLPLYWSNDLQSKAIELGTEIAVLQMKNDLLGEDVRKVEKQLSTTENSNGVIGKETKQLHEKSKNDLRSIQFSTIEIKGKINLQEYYLKMLKKISIYAFLGIVIGLILSIYGFKFWYIKLQQPLDLQLYSIINKNDR
ncbi:hypothetical protein SAMN02745220_01651 [Desulfopila aestuarii DSM 18488]|uniref:Four helix bundle sensory module for signal transduction n=2 Tax=Desulfopila aestuarii TaxID=231440 RepID=A0A1M7Y3N0_9BACT|nr:hypothetical protein SAMN02745220_01651 [Desulfopila aestuarii DSM 18488]